MSETDRLQALAGALKSLLDGASAGEVDDSLRRIAMAIARDAKLSQSLREVAAVLLDQSGEDLLESARQLHLMIGLASQESASDEASGAARHAMVVEADPGTAETIKAILGGSGWRITLMTTSDGVSQRLHSDRADLILIDVFLPDRDGRDLILDLAQSSVGRDVPIIAIAPASQRASLTKSECLALGAERFLNRSQLADSLADVVTELTGETDTSAPSESPATPSTPALPRVPGAVLSRGQFGVRYATRESSASGGCVALVHMQGLRDLAESVGSDEADLVVREIAGMLASELPDVVAIGRWATLQLILLLPNLDVETAADRIRSAALLMESHPWTTRAQSVVENLTVSVVDAPRQSQLDDRVSAAGRLRLGLSREGVLIRGSLRSEPGRPPHVTVVEDDPVTQALVVHKLRHAGFEVTPFADGNRALAAFQAEPFDLYLLDINLPGRDGFELIRAIRSNERIRTRPILVLSSMGSDADVVRGLDLGADDYMLKPFSPVEMTARVRRLLGGTDG